MNGMYAIVLLSLLYCSLGFIVEYVDTNLSEDSILWSVQGLYIAEDSPAIGSPGQGRSYINFSLDLRRTLASNSNPIYSVSEVEVAAFETGSFEKLGYFPSGQTERKYCCDEIAIIQNACTIQNSIIVPEDAKSEVQIWKVKFDSNGNAQLRDTYTVVKTGLHYVLFSRCDKGIGDVSINGQTEWMNPYGFISGELYGSLSFDGSMTFFYFGVALLWFFSIFCYWKELQAVQNWMSVVIVLATLEMSIRYFELIQWNQNGIRSVGTLVVVIFVGALKDGLARFFILIVSMGYGIVKTSLGWTLYKCLFLTTFYFVAVFIQRIVQETSHGDPSAILMYFLILPINVFNIAFFSWIFTSLTNTVQHLESRKQTAKLWLFRTFQRLLTITLIIAIFWNVFYFYQVYTNSVSSEWQMKWIYGSFWDVLFFIVFSCVAFLWRPSKNSIAYTSMEQVATEEDVDDDNKHTNSDEFGLGDEEEGQNNRRHVHEMVNIDLGRSD